MRRLKRDHQELRTIGLTLLLALLGTIAVAIGARVGDFAETARNGSST